MYTGHNIANRSAASAPILTELVENEIYINHLPGTYNVYLQFTNTCKKSVTFKV